MKPVVYVLRSLKNGRYYVGSTDNMERRLEEHNSGKNESTKHNVPFKLVFWQEFDDIRTARQIEYQLKSKKSRKIIERIIEEGRIKFIENNQCMEG